MSVDDFINLIRKSTQHIYLYHFTDHANFPSISQNGLLSKEQMRKRGLWPPLKTGGNALSHSLDLQCGVDPYVSLCFTRNHPMKFLAVSDGRLTDPRYLAIDPSVLTLPGVRVTMGVANSNNVENLSVQEALAKLDAEVIYTRTDWSDPEVNLRLRAAEKCEILVPNQVPVEYIKGFY